MFWNSSDRRKQEELKRQQEQEGKLYETQQKTIFFFSKIIFQKNQKQWDFVIDNFSNRLFSLSDDSFLFIWNFVQENVFLVVRPYPTTNDVLLFQLLCPLLSLAGARWSITSSVSTFSNIFVAPLHLL